MGTSDSFAMPVLLFVVVYMIFVVLMLGLVGYDVSTSSYELTTGWSITNIIQNIPALYGWGYLIFSPMIIGLTYIAISLAIPGWI